MPLITLQNVDYSVGGPLLLEHADLSIEPGERIALIGRNGAGKSTLLKLLAGELQPDDGQVRVQAGVRVARLEQEVPGGTEGSIFDVVAGGLGDLGAWLAEFHHLSHAVEFDAAALSRVQAKIDAADGWALDRRVGEVLSRLELDGEAVFARLSGGMKRRVLLARSLVSAPDVLLLDEPTNHLDIEAIDWLESFLKEWSGSVVFVTHDRRFLRALATRIVEIERGQVSSWPGDWANYERRREERLHAEAQENARFDKLLAQEEVWIRQGIKARRTRDEGRVRRLKAMRAERSQRRELAGNVRMEAAQGESSGKKVVEARGISFAYGDRPMVRDFSTVILRGDRIGLIGPNGSGKTTLLNLLSGYYQPTSGAVRIGHEELSAAPVQRRAVAGVARTFQKPRLLPMLSVLDNAMLGAWTHARAGFLATAFALPAVGREDRALRERATELLHGVGLGHVLQRRANLLDHAEQRFLEVARGLALRPRFLLLDEPAGGLTTQEIDHLASVVRTIRDAGIGVLLVEHHTDFVFRVCDRVTTLNVGRMICHGLPDAVRQDPEVIRVYLGA